MSDGNGNNNGGNNGGNKNASDRLSELLGFDPTKRPTLGPKGGTLFTEALADIVKEREEKAKVQATELFRKAIGLSEERNKARRAFSQADAKFEKELGKVLNEINGLVSGREPEPAEAESAA
jgi:hypothetical protein